MGGVAGTYDCVTGVEARADPYVRVTGADAQAAPVTETDPRDDRCVRLRHRSGDAQLQ